MATGKRYYWIKLKESFMTSDAVDFLMGQKDGANYVVLYQMLCLKTINTGGKLERHIGEVIIPYDETKIQRDTKWFSIDTVRVALNLYKALGLIYQDQNGTLALANYENLVGSETDWALQKRKQGSGNIPQELPPMGVESGVENFHTDIEKDIRDKISDIEREKDIDSKDIDTVCTEPQAPPVLTMILNTGEEYPFDQNYIDQMQSLYPAVDVLQEMREMKAWCISNPKKRKTSRGIKAFVNGWLSREQDRGGRQTGRRQSTTFMDIYEKRHGTE